MPISRLDADSFGDFVHASTPVLVDFYAENCPASRKMDHVFDQIADRRPNLPLGMVNVEIEPDLAGAYVVRTTPTILLMQCGDIAGRWTGETDAGVLLSAVDQAGGTCPPTIGDIGAPQSTSMLHDYLPYSAPRMYADPFAAPDPLI